MVVMKAMSTANGGRHSLVDGIHVSGEPPAAEDPRPSLAFALHLDRGERLESFLTPLGRLAAAARLEAVVFDDWVPLPEEGGIVVTTSVSA
jgi:hypothetical protein